MREEGRRAEGGREGGRQRRGRRGRGERSLEINSEKKTKRGRQVFGGVRAHARACLPAAAALSHMQHAARRPPARCQI